MKKLTAILIATVYLLLTVGATVSMQFCCGDIASIELYAQTDPCCADGTEDPACCDEQVLVVQFNEQQGITNGCLVRFIPAEFDIPGFSTLVYSLRDERPVDPIKNPALPAPSDRPIWLMQCSLVYYG